MLDATVRELRDDFAAAISSIESDVTLDPSIAELRDKISRADFLKPFSIYSKGHLRRIDESLRDISTTRLKNDPLQVALARPHVPPEMEAPRHKKAFPAAGLRVAPSPVR